jgi:hypothetical protein
MSKPLLSAYTHKAPSTQKARSTPETVVRVSVVLLKSLGVASFLVIGLAAFLTKRAGDPLDHIIPNALLFTPYKQKLEGEWDKRPIYDGRPVYDHQHIPIMAVEDYTYERIAVATENFRRPVVVRGFFNGTTAVNRWTDPEFLAERLGDFETSVIQNALYGTAQTDRVDMPIKEALADVFNNEHSTNYLFFPPQSRFNQAKSSADEVKERISNMVIEDLDLDRIFKGFGKKKTHRRFHGAQILVGRGTNNMDATTGTGWHCAFSNNWFAQVIGRKRWYFMDGKYSKLMKPVRNGEYSMQQSKLHGEYEPRMPLQYADLQPGDVLYNPDWQWHTVKNYGGLTLGVPIREFNLISAGRNNLHYSAIGVVNHLYKTVFGRQLGGYPGENN